MEAPEGIPRSARARAACNGSVLRGARTAVQPDRLCLVLEHLLKPEPEEVVERLGVRLQTPSRSMPP